MTRVAVEREVECQSDICALWPVIADTNRMNRAVGMDKLELTPLSDGSAARYLVHTKIGGMPVVYEERPYEWVYPERFKVKRPFRSGPFLSLEFSFELKPSRTGGTLAKVCLAVEPRQRLMTPVMRFMVKRSVDAFARATIEADRAVAGLPREVEEGSGQVNLEAHARAAKELSRGEHPEAAAKVMAHLRDATDVDVSRIRPFELADNLGVDRREMLATCLSAVRAGALELRWEIICPSCRTATDVLPSLSSLTEHGACQLCEIEFAIDLEQAVEATFAPNAAIRTVETGQYCIGGPARTPHVVSQAILAPRSETTLVCPEGSGRYRLFVRGGVAVPIEIDAAAPAEVHVDTGAVGDETGPRSRPARAPIRIAPKGTLHLANDAREERHAKVEKIVYADVAARAQLVTSMPGFRRDFSNDILRPGTALKVARVGLFFSDLTGSTQLYSNVGDAAAFKLVQDHFDLVIKLIERQGGSLVKTIGDAVMAVFSDDLSGLVASVAILDAFAAFRAEHEHRQLTHIKLGVYGGPCYVVTANGILDYFGQSVNVAARLQGEAHSGELVVVEELAERAIAAKKLDPRFVRERYDAKLKGVDHPIRAVRIRL
jgi:class 3 adenylate cyclase